MDKNIIRVEKDKNNPYVMMNKVFLSDARLSFKAKGILSYLLSKPDNWKVQTNDLVKQSIDGERAVYSGLKELKELGYLKKYPVHIEGKIHHWESIVFETPEMLEKLLVQNSKIEGIKGFEKIVHMQNVDVQNVDVENVDVENRGHNNNKRTLISNKLNNQSVCRSKKTDRKTDTFIISILERLQSDLCNYEGNTQDFIISTIKDLYYRGIADVPIEEVRELLPEINLLTIQRADLNYRFAADDHQIKNKYRYYQVCLFNAIQERKFDNVHELDQGIG